MVPLAEDYQHRTQAHGVKFTAGVTWQQCTAQVVRESRAMLAVIGQQRMCACLVTGCCHAVHAVRLMPAAVLLLSCCFETLEYVL